MNGTPGFDSAAEKEALRKILRRLPKALWKSVIDAGKATPLAAFGLTFLGELQDACQSLQPEHRQEMALALRRARFEDIETELKVLGCEQREQQKVLAKILQALGNQTAMVDGYAPQREDLLAVVGRLDTLPDEILIPVRAELDKLGDKLDAIGRRQVMLEVDMKAQPDRVKEAILDERERERIQEYDDFEQKYFKHVQQEYGYIDLFGIPNYASRPQPIDAAFITLSLSGAESDPLPAEAVLEDYPRLVIRGDAGAGKTTLMQWLCIRYCKERHRIGVGRNYAHGEMSEFERDETWPGPIPFFLKLRKLVEIQGDPAFPPVDKWVKLSTPHLALKPPDRWLHQALKDGRVVLMLDGLDELQDIKRPQFWRELQRLLNQYPRLRFRVTSRPFPTDGDKADQWRPPQVPDSDGGTPVVEVQPLTPGEIDLLIDHWHKAAVLAEPTEESREQALRDLEGYAEALKRKIRESDYRRILDLASTPFLCAAICLINRFRKQLLPKERHNLYKMLIEALISLRDKQREIRVLTKEYDLLTTETLVRVHAHLALEMMTSGELRRKEDDKGESPDSAVLIEAKKTDARRWLKDCIDTIPTLYGKTDAAQLLDYMIVRCGLLREPVAGKLDFRHRALQEYLAGTGAVQSAGIGLLVNNAHDDRWRDTIVLAAGGYNVGHSEAIRLINELIDRGEKEDLTICFALAVACLETAQDKLNVETQQRALDKLSELVPPRNSQDAKVLSVAGDRVVDLLAYEELEKESEDAVVAGAETLRRIGTDAARSQILRGDRSGYWSDGRLAVVAQILQCPGIHPLELPAIVKDAAETRKLAIPACARPYLKNLKPLKNLPNLESLDLYDCRQLVDFSGLSSLTKLQTLDLNDCEGLVHPTALSSLKELRVLNLRVCANLASLEPLRSLTKLGRLDLSYCPHDLNVAPLDDLPALHVLEWLDRPELEILTPKEPPADPKARDVYFEILDGARLKMVWLAEGMFRMGSPIKEKGRYENEDPQHGVELTSGFWMSAYPVTQSQYEAVMGENRSSFKERPHNPVEMVSWNDAVEFCEKLSQRTGGPFALPTEAQWEYACRAGSEWRFCIGDSSAELGDFAWYKSNSGGQTHPVGKKKPNDFGLYDVHGNVWEWCRDWYGKDYYKKSPKKDPEGPATGKDRVLRGGSWRYYPRLLRAALRGREKPDYRSRSVGFRIVRTQE